MSVKIRSEVYLREDLAAMLASIALTASATGGRGPQYQDGFAAAIYAMAVAIHVDPQELIQLAHVRVTYMGQLP
jgi:hypothetical protein